MTLPRILQRDKTTWFLELRRRFRAKTGRELGFAHATRFLARLLPGWRSLALEGPDGRPLYIDLREREGYLAHGYTNTVGHMAAIIAATNDGDVVLDVGANIGVWTRQLLTAKRLARVVAFEPDPRTFTMLAKNLAGYAAASCEQVAVGDHLGSVQLSRGTESKQNYVATAFRAAVDAVAVPMITIDHFAEREALTRLDLLKVDVEGLELDVFHGAEQTLRRLRPRVYFEYLPRVGDRERAAFEWLQGLGYRMRAVRLDGSAVPVTGPDDCDRLSDFSHDVIAEL